MGAGGKAADSTCVGQPLLALPLCSCGSGSCAEVYVLVLLVASRLTVELCPELGVSTDLSPQHSCVRSEMPAVPPPDKLVECSAMDLWACAASKRFNIGHIGR